MNKVNQKKIRLNNGLPLPFIVRHYQETARVFLSSHETSFFTTLWSLKLYTSAHTIKTY